MEIEEHSPCQGKPAMYSHAPRRPAVNVAFTPRCMVGYGVNAEHMSRLLVKATHTMQLDTSQGNPINSLSRPVGVATGANPATISPCNLPETYGHKLLWALMGVNAQHSG